MKSLRLTTAGISWKSFAPALLLVFNSLVWYTVTFAVFSGVLNPQGSSITVEVLMVFVAYYLSLTASALLGARVSVCHRDKFLVVWMMSGVVVTMMSATVVYHNTWINMVLSVLLGISTGAGLPSCLAYFADATLVENRGIHSGIAWSTVGFGTLVFVVLVSGLDLTLTFVTLSVWRVFGLISFFLLSRRSGAQNEERISPTFSSVVRRRAMVLYMLPWIMFCLVNFIDVPILQNMLGSAYTLLGFVEFAISGVSAIIGGVLSDLVGRKRVVITGFVILGIEYAVLSLFSAMDFSRYLYTVLDGFAWGMFACVFFMTVWGDLAETHPKEKYYTLGGLPYLLSTFLTIAVTPYVGVIQPVAAFSVASFFLFLAVLPLMYAPETLPEKKIQERELRDYVEKARKTKEKYT